MDNSMLAEAILAALADAVGRDRVSVDPTDLSAHGRDTWPELHKWTDAELQAHTPVCVVRPRNTAEVAAVIRTARTYRVPVVPYGAGSGVVGAAVPVRMAISLDTRGLNQEIELDEDDLVVTAAAGVIGGDLERHVNQRGYTLGQYPQSLHLATVGGWVSTRATGTFSGKYGGIESSVYALEVVLPTGEVVQTAGIARSSTGPRVADLFIGAEGTLGIVTRVTLRLYPQPEARRFRGIVFPTVHDGISAVKEAYRRHLVPAVARLYEERESTLLYSAAGKEAQGPLMITGVEGSAPAAEMEEKLLLEVCSRYGGRDLGPDLGIAWEANRFNAEWLELGNAGDGRMADAIDVAASWKRLPAVYDSVTAALRPLCSELWAHFSHFSSHGGSIYFIIFIDAPGREAARAQYTQAWSAAMHAVLAAGGSIAHHHGVGLARGRFIQRELGNSFLVLQRIKSALDPDGILNPGKLAL